MLRSSIRRVVADGRLAVGRGALSGFAAVTGRRTMSDDTKAEAPKFDAELAAIYNKMSENHRHERGPWPIMTAQVVKAAGGGSGDGMRVVDLASGPGEPAMSIAAALPMASVVATDVSEDMVAAAAATVERMQLSNCSAALHDAQDLSAFASNSVDAVTCCYGYMFPEDKALALTETLRILKPGGLLVATTWDRVDILKISRDVMTAVLGEAPPPPPLNPMALSEPGLFASMLAEAGFVEVEQTTSTYPFEFGSSRDFQFKVGTILLKQTLDKMGPEAWKKAEQAFWENIEKYAQTEAEGAMILPENTFRLSIARKAL